MSAPKKVKIAFIEAMMPELKGPYIYKTGRGEAGNMVTAVARAFKDLRKQIKGKRASIFKCTITLTEKANNEVQRITEEVCITCGQPKDAPEHKSKHQFEAKKEPNEAQV